MLLSSRVFESGESLFLPIYNQILGKTKAFLAHLALSVLIFCSVFYVLFTQWFPDPFFTIDGGLRGVKLIAIVDLVVGPILTMIVYRTGKKNLVFDLLVIAALQFSFLIYGIWTLYSYRPIALIYYKGEFFSVDASRYRNDPARIDNIKTVFHKLPAYIYVDLPDDMEKVSKLRKEVMLHGETLFLQTQYYREFSKFGKVVLADARDLIGFFEKYPEEKLKMDDWLRKRSANMDDYAFVPALSRFQRGLMSIDVRNGHPAGYVDIKLPMNINLPYTRDIEKSQSQETTQNDID